MRFKINILQFCTFNGNKFLLLLLLFFALKIVNAQTISNTTISNTHFCLGGTYTVSFNTTGTTGSIFTVQLSNNTGSFSTFTNLDSNSTNSISITIPLAASLSNNYKLRVVRRAGPTIIGDTLSNLTITKPSPSFSYTNNTCAGTIVSFTNSSTGNGKGIASYSWNFSVTAGAPSSPNTNANPSVSFNPANGSSTINYNVILTATDSFGCTNTANNTVTIRQKPIPVFTFNDSACSGSNVSFSNTSTGAGSLNYSWNFSTTTGAPSSPNTNVNPVVQFNPAVGGGTVSYSTILTVTDGNGCINTANKTVTIRQKPIPAFTFTNNNTCAGSNVNFTNTSTGASPLSYSWSFSGATGAPTINTAASPTVQFNPAFGGSTISYTVRLVVTDGYGCKDSINNTVDVKQKPDPSIDTTNNMYWDQSQGIFLNCGATRNNPTLLFSLDNNSSTTANNTNYSINWGDGTSNFTNTTFTNATHQYNSLGYFTITITVSSLNCSSTKNYFLFNGNTPAGGLLNPGNLNDCLPVTITWPIDTSGTNQNAPGTTYLFTVNDGSADLNYTQSNLPLSISHTFNTTSCGSSFISNAITYFNSYQAALIITNPCGIALDPKGPIKIATKPKANFNISPNSICTNSQITFTNNSIGNYLTISNNSNNCRTNLLKLWTITPGILGVDWNFISSRDTSTNINVVFLTPGNYQIKLKISLPNVSGIATSCPADSITKTICVQPPPTPSFTLNQNPSSQCVNNIVSVNNTSNSLLSCGTTQYIWSVWDSLTSLQIKPTPRFSYLSGTDSSSVNPIFSFSQKGRYKIRLQIVNKCAGIFTKDTFIIIKDKPIVSLPNNINYCDSQTITFNLGSVNHKPIYDSSYGTISSYNWKIIPNTGFTYTSGDSTSKYPTIKFINYTTSPITYKVILSATNECGVSVPDTQNITINPRPQATASAIPSKLAFCSGGTSNIVLSNNLSSVVRYTWRAYPSSNKISGFGNQLIGVTGPIIQTLINTGSVNETVLYRIVAKDTLTGCLGDSTSIIITVYPIPRVIATSQTICSGSATNLVLTSNVSSTLFTWTAATTGSTTGFSNQITAVTGPIAQTLTNNSNITDTVRYTIRAIANGCSSLDTLIKVAVKPIPQLSNTTLTQIICSGDTARFIPTSNVSGTIFNYTTSTISGVATGQTSSGSGDVLQRLFNAGTVPAIVRYSYTPSSGGTPNCIGSSVNFEVTVKPKPILTVTSSSSICSGSQTNIVLNSGVAGTLYQYNATLLSGTNTSGFYSKTTDTLSPISQVITNIGSTNAVVRYYITPIANACKGDSLLHEVTVYPGVIAGTVGSAATVCSGSNAGTLNLSGNTGAVVRWELSVAPFTNWSIINNIDTTQNYLNLTQTTWYRAVIQSGGLCPTVNTLPVIITVDSITIAGNLTGIDTVCIGTNSGILTLINKRGNIVNWQLSNTLPTWNNIGTTTVNPYTFNNLTQTTWFRVSVKNGVCPAAFSDSVRIQVDALPSAAIAPNRTACANSISIGINDSLIANTITSGIGLWTYISGPNTPSITSPNATTSLINNMAIGTHLIQWKVSNGKCPANKDTLQYTVYAPLYDSIASNQTICSGQTSSQITTITTSGGNGSYTFQWQSSPNGSSSWTNISGATSTSYSPGSPTATTYYRKMVISGNCLMPSNTIMITVLPVISNTISGNASICFGDTASIIGNNVATGGNGTYSYQWQDSTNGSSWSNISGDTLSNYSPGILTSTTFFRRLVNSGPCSSTSGSVTITVFPLPNVNAGGDSSKCQNQLTYPLYGSPAGGIWSGTGVSSNNFNPSAMALGNYTLVYTFTNANGCTNRDTAIITVIAPPTVNAGNDFSICENAAAIQLTGTTPATGGSWSGTAVTSSGMFNPTAAGAGTFKLFYNFTAGSGCGGLDSLLVTVNPKPSPDFTLPPQICPNNSITLATSTNVVATVSGYNWIVTNNGSLSNNILSSYNSANPVATFPENKTSTDITYSIKLITITNNGCIDSVSNPVLLLKRPLAQFTTGSNINCGPAVYTITNGTSNVTSSYVWSTNPSAFVNINTSTSISPQITFPVNISASAIAYNIQLIATRNDGIASCKDTAIVPITVYPKPIISFTASPNDSGCSPLTVNFNNTSNPQNTENINTMNFLWNFGIYGTDTARNPQRIFTNTGTVDSITNIKVIGTSKWGCKDSIDKIINVFPFPKANFSSGNYAYCAPLTLDSSNITLVPYPIANSQYLWQIINKAGNILSSHAGTGIPTYTINTPNDTIYYRLITSHTRGCKPDTLTRMFVTIANPVPSFTMSDTIGCSPLAINFTNNSTAGVISTWTISNGLIPASTNPFALTFTNLSNTDNKIDSVKLVVSAGSGCKDSITKSITVYPKPKAIFNLPNILCADTTKTPTNSSVFKTPSVTYGWKFINLTNNSINDTTLATPTFTFINNQTGIDSNYTIRLRATSIDGCIHDTTQNMTVYKRPLAVFSLPTTYCGPKNDTILNSTALNSTWNWSSSPSLIINNATSKNPIVSFPLNTSNNSINYSIKLTATRIGTTCLDTTSRLVTIYPKPKANFTMITKDSCGPRLVNFTNTSDAKNGESLNSMSFLWTYLSNNISTTNATGYYTNTGIIDSLYYTRLIATSMHGCKDTLTDTVTVRPNAKAVFTDSITTSCAPFIINASNVKAKSYPNANSTYKWYVNNVPLLPNGITFPGYTIPTANDSVLIKLVTTSLNGCKDDSMQVWFRTIPNPVPNFTMSDTIGCSPLAVNFTNTSTTGVISTWTISNGLIPASTNPFALTFTNLSNTDNKLDSAKLVITAGTGCKDSITKKITIYPKPKAIFSLPNILCADTTKTPTNSSVFKTPSVTYGWKFINLTNNSINDTTLATPTFTFNNNQTGMDKTDSILLRVTSIDACIDSIFQTITINRRPLAKFSVPTTYCGPASVTISDSTNNVSVSWLWSSNPALSFTTATSQNPSVLFPLNNTNNSIDYRIKLTATRTGTTCLDTTTRLVTIYPKPQAAFTTVTKDSCGPRLVNFTNTSDAKNGESLSSMSYLWTYLNTNYTDTNTAGTFTNTGVVDALYNIRLIATSKHGCIDSAKTNVTVWPNPKADFVSTIYSSCAPFLINNSIVTLTQYPIANDLYTWQILDKLGAIISSSTGTSIPVFTISKPNETFYYRLITSHSRGCKPDTLTRMFVTIPNPVPNFTMNDSAGCTPLTVNFTNTSTVGVSSVWTISNGVTPANTNSFNIVFNNISNTNDATYTAKLVITAGTGCKDSITKTITVYPKPKAIFNLPNIICADTFKTATNASIFKGTSVTYGWRFNTSNNYSINDITSPTPIFTFINNQTGVDKTDSIRLLVTSVNGCIDSITKPITINRRPLAKFIVPTTYCGPASVTISDSTNNVSVSWLWSSNPALSFTTATSQNPSILFPVNNTNNSIDYRIKLTATRTGTTCLDTTTRLVTIYPKPQASFTTVTKDSCGPRLVNFTNTSDAKNGESLSSMSYLWTYLNTNFTDTNTAGTFTNTGVVDALYNIRLIATSKHGCKDTLTDSVIVRPNAKALFDTLQTTSCAPFKITATNVKAIPYPNANSSYLWFVNNVSLGNNIVFPGYTIVNQNDSVLIKLVATSKNGCKNDTMQVWFRTIPNPRPNYTAIDSIGCTPLIVNFNNTSNPISGVGFRWEFGNNSNISAQTNPKFTFYNYGITDTIVYTKLVITANGTGCSDSITKPIVIKPLPRPDLNLSDSVLCYPNLLNVTNLSANIPIYDITSFKWKVIGPDAVSILNDTANSSTNISFPDNKTGANKFYQIWLKIRSTYGCIDSIKKTIRIPTRPISSFNFSADSSCAPVIISTNNTAQYANTFSWTSTEPNVIINNPNMINTSIKFPSHKGTIDFIYPIKLISQTIAGCYDTIIKPFKVFPLPISNFTLNKDSGCSPLSVIFYNSTTIKKPASYFWNFGDGSTQINNADTFTKTFIGSIYQDTTYEIQLISTSANGCKDTTFKTIKVKASAFAKIKLNDTLICSNAVNPTKLTILNKSFGSVDTFYWDFGDGTQLISTIDSTIHHPYPIEGTYTIILKATNSCKTSYDTSKITVQTPPTVNFSKSDSIGCSPLAVTFSNLSTNIYKAKFLWSFGNGAMSSLITPPTINYLQSRTQDTTYYMSLTVSNFCGVYQKNDSIKVLPKPIALFLTSADSGCSPLPVYMINQSVGLPINYKWYFGNGDSSLRFAPLQTPITYRTIDTISYFKIKLIATNTCGIDSMEKTIKVFPNTVKSFFTTSGNAGCEGLMVNFYDNSTGGNSISWNFGDGITSLLKNPIHQYNKPGTFYAYQYVNNGCSFDTSFVIISVLPNPQFTISKSAPNICIKNPVQFNANLKDSGVITWYFGDGDTSNAYNPIHNYNSAGKKIITVMLKSFYNSCISIKYDTINVLPIPVITLTADTNQACAYHLFKLSASSPQTNIFNWDFGDNNTGAGSSLTHLYQFGGTYTVKILAQTSFGCIDSTTKQLIVFPVPTSAFSYTPKDTCNGPVTVKFTNLSVGANNFLWNFGNGNNSSNLNPTTIYSNVGSYPIQLISNNQFSCYDTSKSEYFVYQTPKAALDFTPESGCPPLQVTFINKSQFGTSYLWEFGDGETDTSFSPNHTYKLTGKYKVILTAKAGTYCLDSVTADKLVTVFAKPKPVFTWSLKLGLKPYRTVEFKSSTDSIKTYEWYYGTKLIGRGPNPTYKFDNSDSGTLNILLKITSIDGCDTSFVQSIELPSYWCGLYVPNAFTPTLGEGGANEFKPIGIEIMQGTYSVRVYSKWGELIWESTELTEKGEPKFGWDGNDKEGKPCMQGSYIWVVEAKFTNGEYWEGMLLNNGKVEKRSNVTLIR